MSKVLKTAPTSIDVTGGTDLTFTLVGSTPNGDPSFVVLTDELISTREYVISAKRPKVQASSPSGYTQARTKGKFLIPKTLASGARTVNTISVELAVDIETTDAEKTEMLYMMAQALFDADFVGLHRDLDLT